MDPRYARNVPALSEAECELLRRKRVLVVGCGGLGGHLIDMLARMGIGSLRVVDGDAFEPSNLNRQLLSEVSLLGVGKAQTAAERVRRVNPNVAVHAVGNFLRKKTQPPFLQTVMRFWTVWTISSHGKSSRMPVNVLEFP